MKIPKIVLFTPLPLGSPTKLLLDRLNYDGILEVVPHFGISRDMIPESLANADALLCRPNDGISFETEDLANANRPFVAGSFSSGTDHFAGIQHLDRVSIASSHGGNAGAAVELAVHHAISLSRRAFLAARAMESGLFDTTPGTRIEGKRWLVVGAGRHAEELVPKIAALGVSHCTIYHDSMNAERLEKCLRLVPKEIVQVTGEGRFQILNSPSRVTAVDGAMNLEECIPGADFISLHIPATPPDPVKKRRGTEGLVDATFLGLMKEPSFLINVARGSLVQEQAVVDWLHSKKGCGYGTDLIDPRAERARDPSLSALHQAYMRNAMEIDPQKRINLIVTSHIGGATQEDFEKVCVEVLDKTLQALGISRPPYGEFHEI